MVPTLNVNIIPVTDILRTVASVTAHSILVEKVQQEENGLKKREFGVVKTVNGFTTTKQLSAYRPSYQLYSKKLMTLRIKRRSCLN